MVNINREFDLFSFLKFESAHEVMSVMTKFNFAFQTSSFAFKTNPLPLLFLSSIYCT